MFIFQESTKHWKKFEQAWNNHPLSSESNYSPLQLFYLYSIGNDLFDDNEINPATYGIDGVPTPADDMVDDHDLTEVSVPETHIPLSENALQILNTSVNPLQESYSYGTDIYMQTVSLVFQLMQNENLC